MDYTDALPARSISVVHVPLTLNWNKFSIMKKRFAYTILLLLFFGTSAFVVYRFNKNIQKPVFYHLKERKSGSQSEEWVRMEQQWKKFAAITAQNPNDIKNRLALAMLYIEEGRITGDHAYYDAAALQSVNQVLAMEPNNFEALTLKALVELSQHHFSDGLITATRAQKINPYNAFVYGLLVDANVETGNYNAAVSCADSMISIRPDIRSYSRISYLREIHGDHNGSIEAMQMAVNAGAPGDESTEWSRIQLARLYEENGALIKAESLYKQSLSFRPDYPYALAGLGHVAIGKNDLNGAIEFYKKADALINDHSFKEQLVRLHLVSGEEQKAKSALNEMIGAMTKEAAQGLKDEATGHYADRELAYAYLLAGNLDKALEHALAEYNRRPNNIDVNETVAWVYYKKNETAKALSYLEAALKTGCKNPTLLAHAGLIYFKTGEKEKAKRLFGQVLSTDSNIDIDLKKEVAAALQMR
jgi:tetratricopeptide (TPR) repeat protein